MKQNQVNFIENRKENLKLSVAVMLIFFSGIMKSAPI